MPRKADRKHQHRYPATCPHCEADLLVLGAVLICFYMAEQEVHHRSQLTEDGLLMDVDNLIANGYHSDTLCAVCNKSLAEHETL